MVGGNKVNVNIVLHPAGTIIPRMAQWLTDENGWTTSDAPDENADVNYYMPYLAFDVSDRPKTKTAAWFTHHEEGTPWKMKKWRDAAFWVDLPLVTSGIYADESTVKITPGVDLDFFQPLPGIKTTPGLVGIAGIGQPRKNPHLVCDLFYSGVASEIKIVGRQWPYPHTYIDDAHMPGFYNHLGVFLVTSEIEGIPAPLLEALACDTKVVVPRGVGICDELPEMEGVRKYARGDGASMIAAVRQCLVDNPLPGVMRDVAMGYSKAAWCKSHMEAMEGINAAVPV